MTDKGDEEKHQVPQAQRRREGRGIKDTNWTWSISDSEKRNGRWNSPFVSELGRPLGRRGYLGFPFRAHRWLIHELFLHSRLVVVERALSGCQITIFNMNFLSHSHKLFHYPVLASRRVMFSAVDGFFTTTDFSFALGNLQLAVEYVFRPNACLIPPPGWRE